jgi:phytoene dehydrogenase-like protein
MGAIAHTLAQAVQDNGGAVHYRQEVRCIVMEREQPVAVETKRGDSFAANLVIANLTPWNIARLLGDQAPRRLRSLPPRPQHGGGAFMAYVGMDEAVVPKGFPLHHQVVLREPMGEGNTVFLSLSPGWDQGRAPAGKRAMTISTHTRLDPWWDLFSNDRTSYDKRKSEYVERLLTAAATALPGIRDAAEIVLPANPVTFQRFTRRDWGWVGGFPQTNLFRNWAPRMMPGVWMVGDSIFPGQSTAATALGGMRVAADVLSQYGLGTARGRARSSAASLALR